MKKFIEVMPTEDVTHIKVELAYNKGGWNVFTGENEPRGYYLHVTPVKRENKYGTTLESYMAFSGIKKCINIVSRKSDKQERIAEGLAPNYENLLIEYVCQKNNLRLKEG